MNFERITNRHPSEREAMQRLQQLLQRNAGRSEYSLSRLCELIEPHSREELAVALGEMVREGEIKQIVRVVSPATQGGIGDFKSLAEVPSTLHDWRTDSEIEVQSNDLRVLYVVPDS